MEVVFGERKNAINLRKHGISLERAEDFDFGSASYDMDDREDYGEARWNALGFLDASLYSLTFTQTGEIVRAISLRKANNAERRRYDEAQ